MIRTHAGTFSYGTTFLSIAADFLRILPGSILVGLGFALGCAYVMRRLDALRPDRASFDGSWSDDSPGKGGVFGDRAATPQPITAATPPPPPPIGGGAHSRPSPLQLLPLGEGSEVHFGVDGSPAVPPRLRSPVDDAAPRPRTPGAPALEGSAAAADSEDEQPHVELSLVAVCALLTYAVSERLGMSGIMALFVCGIATRHYTYHNMCAEAQRSATTLFLTHSSMCETALSTLLGVALFDYVIWVNQWDAAFVLLTLPVTLLSRALNIFPLSALANRLSSPSREKLSLPMQVVMWFAGMRGGLCFALAITLDDHRYPHPLPDRLVHRVVASTLVTIAVSTLLLAPATGPLIRSLKLGRLPSESSALSISLLTSRERMQSDQSDGAFAAEHPEEVGASEMMPPLPAAAASPLKIHRVFRWLDARYIKPVFGGRGAVPAAQFYRNAELDAPALGQGDE